MRFHQNPESSRGFVGAALSSATWHWFRVGDDWKVEKIIDVPAAARRCSSSASTAGGSTARARSFDSSREGMFDGLSLGNYHQLVDYTGRLFREGKAAIPAEPAGISTPP